MRAGTVGPVLTVLHDGRVAGAIGPMETLADASGAARLLPQYFGVLPQFRGCGYGWALWRAAMRWGHQHCAAYQLLQTEVGGASDRPCAAEGLTSLEFVNQREVRRQPTGWTRSASGWGLSPSSTACAEAASLAQLRLKGTDL